MPPNYSPRPTGGAPCGYARRVTTDLPVVRLVDIRETPLDVAEVLAALADRAAGGVDVFVGTVRDHDHDQGVTGLDYSAHPTAMQRLVEVAERIAEKYDVIAVAAVHRVGRLAIGDAAVVVATAAAHRGEAFEASRALIDELKASVPIWKHQVFTDGTDEWVGTP
ncbi:molybdenum cofactor biosynthesis protein MoaE [Nocardioides panacis]|uniref:Molybdopterin synthase catalytic subunit 1 n=1 Tax=Nocardioides panacis TaxID=2849501 RepID=A0A975T0H1_9ACTN|nr:molybdenum cofactor biosynthesis protein MoaE [Nocardioides panacis]